MKAAILGLALVLAGCAPKLDYVPIEETMKDPHWLAVAAQRKADEEAMTAKLRAERDETYRQIVACLHAVQQLPLGTSEETAKAATCGHKINRTETRYGVRDQWVFHFADGLSYYLYFERGRLVAKQT